MAASPYSFGFNMTRSDLPRNHYNAFHTHRAPEIFIVYHGEFNVRAGGPGGHSARLLPGDFAIVPPGVERSFECVVPHAWCPELNTHTGNVVTVLPGEGWVQWSVELGLIRSRVKG